MRRRETSENRLETETPGQLDPRVSMFGQAFVDADSDAPRAGDSASGLQMEHPGNAGPGGIQVIQIGE